MTMTRQEAGLWQRLQSLPFDLPDHPQAFSDRLCNENGWSRPYALRVIEEYRKFLLLAAGGEAVPSDAVDQAWHMHLLDTRTYWDMLCADVLGFPLHHVPSRGGKAELLRHRAAYAATLERYRAVFGAEPCPDIWPDAGKRFAGRYRRVNVREAWVVSRSRARSHALALAGFLGLAGCDAQWANIVLGTVILIGIAVLPLLAWLVWTWERRKSRRRREGHAGSGCGSGGTDCGGCGGGCGGGGCGGG